MSKKKATSRAGRGIRGEPSYAHQFLVVLSGTDPLVWRRVEVPEGYSFWDLHVAIQDAMGWQDCHLHEFVVVDDRSGTVERIGIPDREVSEDKSCTAGWEVKVTDYFTFRSSPALYVYDFGDDWKHVLMYEGTAPAEDSVTYPRCISGARRCPPEDSGGAHRYAELLSAIADPDNPAHAEFLEWLGGDFEPAAFDAATITFDDPHKRWKMAFDE